MNKWKDNSQILTLFYEDLLLCFHRRSSGVPAYHIFSFSECEYGPISVISLVLSKEWQKTHFPLPFDIFPSMCRRTQTVN